MPIDPKDVKVGHCYAVSGNQHRKVTAIVDGRVHYDSWGEDVGDSSSSGPAETGLPTLETFAGAVEQEISCPDVPRARPSKAEG